MRAWLVFWMSILATTAVSAQQPRLAIPVDCELGNDCFVQKYVDYDKGPGYRDYHCGYLTNDGHKGTDFRVRDIAGMNRGVAVLAAAAGVVRNVREGMPDVDVRLVGRDAVIDRGYGNTVIVDHGGDWRTIYAHLRRGSVAVQQGQRVHAGQALGMIGLSGMTEFPHVHFEVRFGKRIVDPFVGLATPSGCAAARTAPWQPDALGKLNYRPTFLLRAGFSNRPMKRAAMQYGLYDRDVLSRKRGSLSFGVFVAGLFPGDRFEISIQDEAGNKVRNGSHTMTKAAAVQFRSLTHSQAKPLPAGRYRARFVLRRKAEQTYTQVIEIERSVTLR